jgi:hypothetical protein
MTCSTRKRKTDAKQLRRRVRLTKPELEHVIAAFNPLIGYAVHIAVQAVREALGGRRCSFCHSTQEGR